MANSENQKYTEKMFLEDKEKIRAGRKIEKNNEEEFISKFSLELDEVLDSKKTSDLEKYIPIINYVHKNLQKDFFKNFLNIYFKAGISYEHTYPIDFINALYKSEAITDLIIADPVHLLNIFSFPNQINNNINHLCNYIEYLNNISIERDFLRYNVNSKLNFFLENVISMKELHAKKVTQSILDGINTAVLTIYEPNDNFIKIIVGEHGSLQRSSSLELINSISQDSTALVLNNNRLLKYAIYHNHRDIVDALLEKEHVKSYIARDFRDIFATLYLKYQNNAKELEFWLTKLEAVIGKNEIHDLGKNRGKQLLATEVAVLAYLQKHNLTQHCKYEHLKQKIEKYLSGDNIIYISRAASDPPPLVSLQKISTEDLTEILSKFNGVGENYVDKFNSIKNVCFNKVCSQYMHPQKVVTAILNVAIMSSSESFNSELELLKLAISRYPLGRQLLVYYSELSTENSLIANLDENKQDLKSNIEQYPFIFMDYLLGIILHEVSHSKGEITVADKFINPVREYIKLLKELEFNNDVEINDDTLDTLQNISMFLPDSIDDVVMELLTIPKIAIAIIETKLLDNIGIWNYKGKEYLNLIVSREHFKPYYHILILPGVLDLHPDDNNDIDEIFQHELVKNIISMNLRLFSLNLYKTENLQLRDMISEIGFYKEKLSAPVATNIGKEVMLGRVQCLIHVIGHELNNLGYKFESDDISNDDINDFLIQLGDFNSNLTALYQTYKPFSYFSSLISGHNMAIFEIMYYLSNTHDFFKDNSDARCEIFKAWQSLAKLFYLPNFRIITPNSDALIQQQLELLAICIVSEYNLGCIHKDEKSQMWMCRSDAVTDFLRELKPSSSAKLFNNIYDLMVKFEGVTLAEILPNRVQNNLQFYQLSFVQIIDLLYSQTPSNTTTQYRDEDISLFIDRFISNPTGALLYHNIENKSLVAAVELYEAVARIRDFIFATETETSENDNLLRQANTVFKKIKDYESGYGKEYSSFEDPFGNPPHIILLRGVRRYILQEALKAAKLANSDPNYIRMSSQQWKFLNDNQNHLISAEPQYMAEARTILRNNTIIELAWQALDKDMPLASRDTHPNFFVEPKNYIRNIYSTSASRGDNAEMTHADGVKLCQERLAYYFLVAKDEKFPNVDSRLWNMLETIALIYSEYGPRNPACFPGHISRLANIGIGNDIAAMPESDLQRGIKLTQAYIASKFEQALQDCKNFKEREMLFQAVTYFSMVEDAVVGIIRNPDFYPISNDMVVIRNNFMKEYLGSKNMLECLNLINTEIQQSGTEFNINDNRNLYLVYHVNMQFLDLMYKNNIVNLRAKYNKFKEMSVPMFPDNNDEVKIKQPFVLNESLLINLPQDYKNRKLAESNEKTAIYDKVYTELKCNIKDNFNKRDPLAIAAELLLRDNDSLPSKNQFIEDAIAKISERIVEEIHYKFKDGEKIAFTNDSLYEIINSLEIERLFVDDSSLDAMVRYINNEYSEKPKLGVDDNQSRQTVTPMLSREGETKIESSTTDSSKPKP